MAAQRKYPLHWLVWHNKVTELRSQLETVEGKDHIEDSDPHGRTPLHLAVTLGRRQCVELLVECGASALTENNNNWTIVDEAICNGDREVVECCLQANKYQKALKRSNIIPQLLKQLRDAPDFYLEMKWEFTTWLKLPMLSKMCPSDVCKIWKKGANVRVDLSLLGFKDQEWVHGNHSYIFHGSSDACTFIEVDHDRKVYYPVVKVVQDNLDRLRAQPPPRGTVTRLLNSPVTSTILGTDCLAFSRVRNLLGFGSEREEDISGFRTKVYAASGVDIVTRTRAEHLCADDKRSKNDVVLPMQRLIGGDSVGSSASSVDEAAASGNGGVLMRTVAGITTSMQTVKTEREGGASADEYFLQKPKPGSVGDEIGRPMDLTVQKQSFKATASLADNFPLSLRDQVLPVIELMSTHSPHFGRVRDFIVLQLPAGFPMKIEIPIFHIVQASITFGNLNGTSEEPPHVKRVSVPVTPSAPSPTTSMPAGGVRGSAFATSCSIARRRRKAGTPTSSSEEQSLIDSGLGSPVPSAACGTSVDLQEVCMIDDDCFVAPTHYQLLGNLSDQFGRLERTEFDDEEHLLQFAIQQSLSSHSGGTGSWTSTGDGTEQVTFMEALMSSPPASPVPTRSYRGSMTSNEGVTSVGSGSGGAGDSGVGSSQHTNVDLQRALMASIQGEDSMLGSPVGSPVTARPSISSMSNRYDEEEEMRRIMALSVSEADSARQRQQQEDAELERILQLSLTEK